MEKTSTFPSGGKVELLKSVENLPYRKRIATAAKLGRDHKKNPQLKTLINELRTHPAPPAVEREVEEGFSNMLSSQKRDVAKYYNEDQMALNAAAASHEHLDVLKDELTSQSISFKKLVIKEVVRQDKSDDFVKAQILSAPRAVRKQLIGKCIKFRRVALLESLVPEILKIHGADEVATFLHGCSDKVVKEHLTQGEFIHNKNLNWAHLARYHGALIVSMIEKELSTCSVWNRAGIFENWEDLLTKKGMRELMFNSKQTLALLQLVRKYTPATFEAYSSHNKQPEDLASQLKLPAQCFVYTVPRFVNSNLTHFLNHKSTLVPLIDFLIERIDDSRGYLRVCIPSSIWYRPVAADQVLRFIKAVFAKSTAATRKSKYSYDIRLLNDLESFSLRHFSMVELLDLAKVLHSVFEKIQIDNEDARSSIFSVLYLFYGELTNRVNRAMKTGLKNDKAANLDVIVKSFNDINNVLMPITIPRIEAKGVDRTILSSLTRLFTSCPPVPELLKSLFQRIGNLFATEDAFPSTPARLEAFGTGRESAKQMYTKELQNLLKHLITTHQKASKNERLDEKQRATAVEQQGALFKAMWYIFTQDPVENTQLIAKFFPYMSVELRESLWREQLTTPEERLKILAGEHFEHMMRMINLLPIKSVQPTVKALLADDDTMTKAARDKLLAYQDVEDHDIRKQMQKAADSKNPTERLAAMKRLVVATILSKSAVQAGRTLKYIRDKIKNEAIDRRNEVFNCLVYFVGAKEAHEAVLQREKKEVYVNSFLRDDTPDEQFEMWLKLLQDLLEAPDLNRVNTDDYSAIESHASFKHFWQLSKSAIARGSEFPLTEEGNALSARFLAFAFEIQWRIGLYIRGDRKAVEKFKLATEFVSPTANLPYRPVKSGRGRVRGGGISHDPFKRRPGFAKRFVETIVNIALPKFRERFPRMKVHDLGNFFAPLFQAANAYWKDLPVLTSYLNDALENLKKTGKKDEEGLLVIEHDNPIFKVFEPLLTFKRQEHWSKIPALNDYVETILHSRQAPTVLKQWMYHHEVATTKNGTKAQRAQKRDETVTKLLSISRSALHLKFVWHHLFENRQDLLDKYINEADPKSYRGVFYVNPDDRPLYKKVEVEKVVVQAKVGVRRARGSPVPVAAVVKSSAMLKAVHNVREVIAKQNDAEDKIKDEMSLNGDHRDFYTFEGCYKLSRLLPRQSLTLAAQWLRHLLNGDRPMPERIKAAIRWTLLPTTAYYDVVKFLNEYEKEDEKTKRQALPINLVEPVLRGAMHNDEPSAALRWLLSPEFLGSERARVAIYAVAQCVPHLPDNGLTTICRTILTGKNRHQLKVTAYKEIMRLLASSPTTENIEMVLHEWNRKELHRDVAITIIQCAFAFLKSPEDSKNALGWKILELTFEKYPSNSEILTTLLATKATNTEQHLNVAPEYNGQEMQQPRVKELMDDLAKREIPKKHVVDYINKVVKRLVNLQSLDEDDDVKHLARVSLFYWREHEGLEGVEYFVEYALKFLSNFNSKLLRSTKVGDQKVFFARSTTMWNFLATCCGINIASSTYVRGKGTVERTLGDRASFSKAIESYTAEIGRLAKAKCTAEESRVRVILLNVFDAVLTDGKIWPTSAVQSGFYDRETELELIAPIQNLGNMYWLETTKRILGSLNHQSPKVVVGPIRDAFTFVLSHPTFISDIVSAITNYVSRSYSTWQYTSSNSVHQVLVEVMDPTFVDVSKLGPEATALLTLLRVKMVSIASKFAEVGHECVAVADLIYNGIKQLAAVSSVLPPDFDLFTDMLTLFNNVCTALSPNVWSGTRVFTEETKRFVKTVIDKCLSAPASGREGELAREFITRGMTQHPEDLALTYSDVAEHNKLMYAVLLHATTSDLSASVVASTTKCIVSFVSDIHFYVDQVFNKSSRQRTNNDLNESPATIAAIKSFLSRGFISAKKEEITGLKINDALQFLINATGSALLNEFPSFLWTEADVSFAFVRSALAFAQQHASAKQLTSSLEAAFSRAMTLSWNATEEADDDEDEKPKDKKKEKHYDLTVTVDLVRRLINENTHLARTIALHLVVSASWETATGDDKVSRPELVALLEQFYNDADETLRVQALKVQTSGKRFK